MDVRSWTAFGCFGLVSLFLRNACCGATNNAAQDAPTGCELQEGGIVRGPKDRKQLALLFTGHEFAEGARVILDQLARHQAKASFFLTGDFLSNTNFSSVVQGIVREGHYLGPHSDKHLLYCSWEKPKKRLIGEELFFSDLHANLNKIEQQGTPLSPVRYFLPPYEHYDGQIVAWSARAGLALINFTPGTRSSADYTGEADRNFVSSEIILESIRAKEQNDPAGLNGFLLLLHVGSGPGRADKFHARFGALLDFLSEKGYRCVRVDELLK